MKALSLFAALMMTASLAQASSAQKAINAFKASPEVNKVVTDLKAKRVGSPIALLVSAMGDGCDYMESFIITQQIRPTTEFFVQRTVAARVDTNTADLDCAGEGRGKSFTAVFGKVLDLFTSSRD